MAEKCIEIYILVETSADADHGSFPNPSIHGSYLSHERAYWEMVQKVIEMKKELDNRYDCEKQDEYHWEMYADGYAAGCFTRFDILRCDLHVSADVLPERHCDTCEYSYSALESEGKSDFFSRTVLRQYCKNEQFNSPEYTHEMRMEDRKANHCRFWTPKT